MYKIHYKFIVVLFLLIFLSGTYLVESSFSMGSNTGPQGALENDLTKSYRAFIVDKSNKIIQTEKLSWDKKNYFQGYYGQMRVSIAFESVQKVEFIRLVTEERNIEYIFSKIYLIDNTVKDILFHKSSKFYGVTSFGEFEVFVRDIKNITFNH